MFVSGVRQWRPRCDGQVCETGRTHANDTCVVYKTTTNQSDSDRQDEWLTRPPPKRTLLFQSPAKAGGPEISG